MKASIVVPLFNQLNFTKSCFEDLSKLEDVELIFVDNNSTDGTDLFFKDKNVKYIRLDKNYGFGYAVNRGIEVATSDFIMTLNNDIKVKNNHSDWVDVLINNSNDCLVGPTVGFLNSSFNYIGEFKSFKENGKYSYMSGWCLGAKRQVWEKIKEDNYFDERFFVYFEDTDLGFRAHQKGIEFSLVEVPVVHFGKQSSKQLNISQLYLNSKKIFEDKWKNY